MGLLEDQRLNYMWVKKPIESFTIGTVPFLEHSTLNILVYKHGKNVPRIRSMNPIGLTSTRMTCSNWIYFTGGFVSMEHCFCGLTIYNQTGWHADWVRLTAERKLVLQTSAKNQTSDRRFAIRSSVSQDVDCMGIIASIARLLFCDRIRCRFFVWCWIEVPCYVAPSYVCMIYIYKQDLFGVGRF